MKKPIAIIAALGAFIAPMLCVHFVAAPLLGLLCITCLIWLAIVSIGAGLMSARDSP